MKKILVVEDETAIREFVVINLQRAGYTVVEAGDGETALELYDNSNDSIDIALLDIMLPGIDGIEVCKELRRRSGSLGIVMLTAKTQEVDKVSGLMTGADDYITKPFSPSELVARVDALHRRVELLRVNKEDSEKDSGDCLIQGNFELNLRRRVLKKLGEPIELTQVEFQIMEYFFTKPNTAIDRTDILDYVWGESYFGEEKIVDVNIRRLRMKIEDDPSAPKNIVTVWGMGYRWKAEGGSA